MFDLLQMYKIFKLVGNYLYIKPELLGFLVIKLLFYLPKKLGDRYAWNNNAHI